MAAVQQRHWRNNRGRARALLERRARRPWLAALLLTTVALGTAQGSAAGASGGIDLLHLPRQAMGTANGPSPSYARWRKAWGWQDRRPFSDSTERFRLERGALRLESRGDSYLIGRSLPPAEQQHLAAWPYLRFVVRIAAVPRGAQLADEVADDAAFRLYATCREEPLEALVYVWSWRLPVGAWSARKRTLWGDFRTVHRKAFGQGPPPAGQWLTVEVNLARDYRTRFPGRPLPTLRALALKADSNHVAAGHSLAWLRAVSLHRTSLRDAGYGEGDRLGDTVVWFR